MLKFEFPTDIERKLFKQLDFALVLTYTKAAQAAQKAVRESLHQRFILRNSFVEKSIRIDPATKKNPVATVFVPTEGKYNADFLLLQETGGIKTPKKDTHLAIPAGVNRTKYGIIKKRDMPDALRTRKSVFAIKETTIRRHKHRLQPGIYQRVGPNKNRSKDTWKLKRLFTFKKGAPVEARFQFQKTAIKAAIEALPKAFEDALVQALRTAR
jgi:hypothetical protein